MHVRTYRPIGASNLIGPRGRLRTLAFSILSAGTLAMFAGFLWVAIGSLSQSGDLRQKAAIDITSIAFGQQTRSVTVGEEFTLPINLYAGSPVAVAEVLPTFDPAFFQPIALSEGSLLAWKITPSTITGAGGFTPLMVAQHPPRTNQPPTGVTGNGTIAQLTLKAKKVGQSTVGFNQARTRAPQFGGPPTNIIQTYGTAQITIAAGAIPLPACVSTTLTPSSIVAGDTRDIEVSCGRLANAADYRVTIPGIAGAPATLLTIAQSAEGTSPKTTFKANQFAAGTTAEIVCSPCLEVTGNSTNRACATPTPACKASLTIAAPPTYTYDLNLEFKQQGVARAGIQLPTTVTVAYLPSAGAAKDIHQYTQTYTSNAAGVLSSSTPLRLTDLGNVAPGTTIEVFVKTPTSLQKSLGTVTLASGTNNLSNNIPLFVGDFVQEGDQKNLFNIRDIAAMLTEYKALDNPITDANRKFDVNFDNNFNVLDVSLVLANYQTLELGGQQP